MIVDKARHLPMMNMPSVTKSMASCDSGSSGSLVSPVSGPTPVPEVLESSVVTHDPDPDPELTPVLISAASGSISRY